MCDMGEHTLLQVCMIRVHSLFFSNISPSLPSEEQKERTRGPMTRPYSETRDVRTG